MRDLTSRLRAIVRQPVPVGGDGSRLREQDPSPPSVANVRELTYVPDLAVPESNLDRTAELLGGVRYDVESSACIAIDRMWDQTASHGRWRIETYRIAADAPIALFDSRVEQVPGWASRVVFFDIETTGLSGGAGTLPLLAGCGWFEPEGFRIRQFFLNGPGGEHALLDGLTRIFDDASLLVTYNGRTFDVPVMETRWAYHRRENATDELPHFDMLPAARRLWGGSADGCALAAVERSVLRFYRVNDVPGLEIPSRYFQFLRTGHPSVIEGVLEHNRYDIVSLAAVMARALRLAADGPESCETAREQLGLARLYESAGDLARAEQGYGLAAASDDPEIAVQALARLAPMLRRQSRFQESARAWQGVLALSVGESTLTSLECRATEALAIHHEHRARDLDTARRYAEALREHAPAQHVDDVDKRLGRLKRKMQSAEGREGFLTE